MRSVLTRFLVMATLFAMGLLGPASVTADPPTQRIVGTGFVDLQDDLGIDVSFRVNVEAYQRANGDVGGQMQTRLNLAEFGLGQLRVHSRVTDMVVDGNAAWLCSVVTHSTNEDLIAVGDLLITMIVDLGGPGEDIMHQEAAANLPVDEFDADGDGDVDCHDRPPLFPSIVDSGNFKVR